MLAQDVGDVPRAVERLPGGEPLRRPGERAVESRLHAEVPVTEENATMIAERKSDLEVLEPPKQRGVVGAHTLERCHRVDRIPAGADPVDRHTALRRTQVRVGGAAVDAVERRTCCPHPDTSVVLLAGIQQEVHERLDDTRALRWIVIVEEHDPLNVIGERVKADPVRTCGPDVVAGSEVHDVILIGHDFPRRTQGIVVDNDQWDESDRLFVECPEGRSED